MAYSKYLIKLGNFEFPLKYIEASSYQIKRNVQDVDSYRDANGVLHRNALAHDVLSVTFTTKPNLTSTQVGELMNQIRSNYINVLEKKLLVTAYVPEYDDYVTQEMYLADIPFTIKGISDIIKYDRITFDLVGY